MRSYAKYLKLHHACVIMNAIVKRRTIMKNLKPVPADKKKSLGKLPIKVRANMGFMKKGGKVKPKMKKKK